MGLRQRIRGLTDQPVVKVIVSHYHADHVYGLQVFQDEGAEIIAPRGSYEYLASNAAAERVSADGGSPLDPGSTTTRLVRPDQVIERNTAFSWAVWIFSSTTWAVRTLMVT